MKLRIILFALIVCVSGSISAQTIFARASGDWDQTTVWSTIGTGGASCGCTPGATDDVVIDGFDVDIDAGTGDVTVNSVMLTNVSGSDVRLRVQAGATLTVSNDFEIESNSAGNDSELTVEGTGSGLDISGDFLADQDAGDDLLIDIDDNAQVNITGDADFLQDGGDDMELSLNFNSGTAAQWNVTGTMTIDHDGGDDIRIRVDDPSSLLDVDEDLIVNMNSGLDDDITFNLDGGDIDVVGDIKLNRANTTAFIWFDMDGGDVDCDSLLVTSSGVTANGEVRFHVDQASRLNCDWFDASFTGGDELIIYINSLAGTTAQFNIAEDFTVDMSGGNDLDINVDQDNAQINVGGNSSITFTGGDELVILMDNNGTWDTDGNFTILTSGGNGGEIDLDGGTDDPTFNVDGNFLWTNQTANVDIVVDLNSGTFSVGGDFSLINGAGGDDIDLQLDDDAELTVGNDFLLDITGGDDIRLGMGEVVAASTAEINIVGDASILLSTHTAPAPIWYGRVFEDTRFIVGGDLNLTTDFTATGLCLFSLDDNAELHVDGDINLSALSSGELELRTDGNSYIRIRGDFVRAASPSNFGEFDASGGNGTVEFRGTTAQVIAEDDGGGGDDFHYMNIEINNTFGTAPQLTLEGDVTVHGALVMNDGVVASNTSDILIVADGATTSGASDDSYVDGYMRKVGNEAFTFPSGDDGFYGPIGITAPSSPSDQFEAQYLHVRPDDDGFDETMFDPTIDHVSTEEYWKLNRTAGSSTPTVTISWDTPRSGGVSDENDLRFMRWDGSSWRDLGAASVTGTATSGTLDNSSGIGSFSDSNPYTLGTIDAINPLPIELTSFTAVMEKGMVHLNWITASEINNDYFTLERSANGIDWEPFSKVDGAGNSSVEQTYSDLDRNPYPGVSYYRLKQTDFDGSYAYFGPISVNNQGDILVYPNPSNEVLYVSGDVNIDQLKMYTIQGEEVLVSFEQSGNLLVLNTSNLAAGTYYVRQGDLVKRVVVSH